MVRAGAPRRVWLGRAEERAVRGAAAARLRYRRQARDTEAGRPRASRTRGVAAPAQALSMVLLDPRGQRGHAPRPARRARFSARLLPSQERGLERQHAAPAAKLDRTRAGKTR